MSHPDATLEEPSQEGAVPDVQDDSELSRSLQQDYAGRARAHNLGGRRQPEAQGSPQVWRRPSLNLSIIPEDSLVFLVGPEEV